MRYSNYIGIIAAIVLIGCCFLPWVHIDSIKTTITGIRTEPTNFGKPGLLHIFFSFVSIILFLLPAIWAKRTNLFMGAFNFAWSIRNFLLMSHCELGECPHKLLGIYTIIPLAALLLIMTLLPDIKLKDPADES
ncbi:MAG TPA: hypothetical protein VF540_00300 [Segetibacter sp.]|jgi:hypothetical protein